MGVKLFFKYLVIRNIYILIALFISILFTTWSCNKSLNEEQDKNGEYRDKPKGKDSELVFRINLKKAGRDVAVKSNFNSGDQIGIFAVRHKEGAITEDDILIRNVKLSCVGHIWEMEEPLYFPIQEDSVDFYAYYPYNVAATNPSGVAFEVQEEQTSNLAFNQSDFLLASVTSVKKGQPVELLFFHQLAFLEITIPSLTFLDPNSISLKINAISAFTSDIRNVTTNLTGNSKSIKMLRVQESSNRVDYSFRVLLPAQDFDPSKPILEIIQGENSSYYYQDYLGETILLSPAKVNRYDLILRPSDIPKVLIPGTGSFITRYPITEGQYNTVLGLGAGSNKPKVNVTWAQAQLFCRELSKFINYECTLPLVSEWKTACRAGTPEINSYFFGNSTTDLSQYAWYSPIGTLQEIGLKKPNPWGLYDVYGNVYEMCLDLASSGEVQLGGGSWKSTATECKTATIKLGDHLPANDVGFRIIMKPKI